MSVIDATVTLVSPLDHPCGIGICAGWNFDEWGRGMGRTLADTEAGLADIAGCDAGQHAVLALVDGEPAGMALLIDCDLESHAHLTPWVAGVLTRPEFRNRGVATAMIVKLEDLARLDGAEAAYLYTSQPNFYARLGWTIIERLNGDEAGMDLMRKSLR